MRGSRESWEIQLNDCIEDLQALESNMLFEKLIVEKSDKEIEKSDKRESNKSFGVALAKRGQRYVQLARVVMLKKRCFVNDFLIEYIRILIKRDYLILLDVTHNSNALQ